jgi:hypothetical protein
MSTRPEYRIWTGIIDRCENPNKECYEDYGGRGIKLHPAWRKDFAAFFAAVGPRPSPRHSVERINNSKGYVPGNLKWATMKEQARNTRRNHLLTYKGKTQPIAAWAEELNLKDKLISERILKLGWSTEKALSTPAR